MQPHAPPDAPRKKFSGRVAVIDVDRCTGCGACIEVCPVDCIVRVAGQSLAPGLCEPCQVDAQRCIGCGLCVHLPRRKHDPYTLAVCPWQAIELIPRNGPQP